MRDRGLGVRECLRIVYCLLSLISLLGLAWLPWPLCPGPWLLQAQQVMPMLGRPVASATGGGGKALKQCGNISQASSGTFGQITLSGVTAGDQIEVIGGIETNGTITACDGSSTSCAATNSTFSAGAYGANAASWRPFESHTLNEVNSGSVTVTVAYSTTTYGMFFACEVSGLTSLDTEGGNTASAGTTITWPTSLTTTRADIIFATAGNGGVNNTYTAGSGWTIPTNGQVSGGGQSAMLEYQITSGSGSVTPTATVTTSFMANTYAAAF